MTLLNHKPYSKKKLYFIQQWKTDVNDHDDVISILQKETNPFFKNLTLSYSSGNRWLVNNSQIRYINSTRPIFHVYMITTIKSADVSPKEKFFRSYPKLAHTLRWNTFESVLRYPARLAWYFFSLRKNYIMQDNTTVFVQTCNHSRFQLSIAFWSASHKQAPSFEIHGHAGSLGVFSRGAHFTLGLVLFININQAKDKPNIFSHP